MYYDYFIGGFFNDLAVDWKWVNGSIIDPNYLMNYPVGGGPDMCLIWSDIFYLHDYPCTATRPAICDIPVTTGLGMQETLSCCIRSNSTRLKKYGSIYNRYVSNTQ